MLNSHAAAGVAQIVLYGPIFPLALYLAFVRHARPRMPWWFLFMFSCFRIASGIVSILYQRDLGNVGLLIAAIITLNVGVIPLLLCTIGFVRIIAQLDHADSERLRKAIVFVRLGFFAGIGLLTAGGVLEGMYDKPATAHTGSILAKAGYIMIAIILITMMLFEAYFWKCRNKLCRSSIIVLSAITAAMPFQVVRIAYALLTIFSRSGSSWNALTGSIGAFIGMALVMEYIVVLMYVVAGFLIDPVQKRVVRPKKEVDSGFDVEAANVKPVS